jgi:hypothetical protein
MIGENVSFDKGLVKDTVFRNDSLLAEGKMECEFG